MSAIGTVELREFTLEETALFRFPSLMKVDRFVHAVTSKPWNMATHCGPERELAITRRTRVCDFLGVPFAHLTAAEQVHSPHVLRIQPEDIGAGRDGRAGSLRFVDGLICDIPGVPVIQFSADCPLVLLVEPQRQIIATAHASWRGTVAHICTELLRQLRESRGVEPSELIAAICPAPVRRNTRSGEDVRRIVQGRLPDAERFLPRVGKSCFFDMRAANVDQLVRGGVDPARISVAAPCTLSDSRFYSYRRDGPQTGRFALVAGFIA